mmetsp:Transcript_5578/g.13454  ORF Transcript_5578/g.13454 Transcript_5578/m.13454 type:complete len:407 (+) Transcript_5578:592-1812(+)
MRIPFRPRARRHAHQPGNAAVPHRAPLRAHRGPVARHHAPPPHGPRLLHQHLQSHDIRLHIRLHVCAHRHLHHPRGLRPRRRRPPRLHRRGRVVQLQQRHARDAVPLHDHERRLLAPRPRRRPQHGRGPRVEAAGQPPAGHVRRRLVPLLADGAAEPLCRRHCREFHRVARAKGVPDRHGAPAASEAVPVRAAPPVGARPLRLAQGGDDQPGEEGAHRGVASQDRGVGPEHGGAHPHARHRQGGGAQAGAAARRAPAAAADEAGGGGAAAAQDQAEGQHQGEGAGGEGPSQVGDAGADERGLPRHAPGPPLLHDLLQEQPLPPRRHGGQPLAVVGRRVDHQRRLLPRAAVRRRLLPLHRPPHLRVAPAHRLLHPRRRLLHRGLCRHGAPGRRAAPRVLPPRDIKRL